MNVVPGFSRIPLFRNQPRCRSNQRRENWSSDADKSQGWLLQAQGWLLQAQGWFRTSASPATYLRTRNGPPAGGGPSLRGSLGRLNQRPITILALRQSVDRRQANGLPTALGTRSDSIYLVRRVLYRTSKLTNPPGASRTPGRTVRHLTDGDEQDPLVHLNRRRRGLLPPGCRRTWGRWPGRRGGRSSASSHRQ